MRKRASAAITILLLIGSVKGVPADVRLVVSPHFRVSQSEIIAGVTVRSDGGLLMITRNTARNGQSSRPSKLLVLSPESELIEDASLEIGYPILVGEVKGKTVLGYLRDQETILHWNRHEWTFPYPVTEFHIQNVDQSIFVAGVTWMEAGTSTFLVRKIIEKGTPIVRSAIDVKVEQVTGGNDLIFSDGEDVYARSRRGIYKLSVNNQMLFGEPILKGRFGAAVAASNEFHRLMVVRPSRMFIQNKLEVRSLPEARLLERMRYPYSVVTISLASSQEYALLLVNGKESISRGELVLLDQKGGIVLRDSEVWDRWFYRLLSNPANSTFFMVGLYEVRKVEVVRNSD